MVLYGVVCLQNTQWGLLMAGIYIALVLVIRGFKSLWQYVTMARFMVNGGRQLVLGLILADAGMFTLISLKDGQTITSLFLMVYMLFSGVVKLLQALQWRMQEASWKAPMIQGLISMAAFVLCIAYFRSPDVITVIFSAGLMLNGVTRVASTFQTTDIVYIQ